MDDVADSIERFGFGNPILARRANREVIAGHTRLKAALKLGLERVPVRFLELSAAEAHLLALADNRLAEKAQWSLPELHDLLKELPPLDVEMVGWSAGELEQIAEEVLKASSRANDAEAEVNEDDAPDPPAEPITKPGDVWLLGEHKLYCGDSTKAASWDAIMGPDERLSLVFTDPPYGVDYVGKTKDKLEVHNDDAEGLPALLDGFLDALLPRCRDGHPWYVCAPDGPRQLPFVEALSKRDLWRQSIVWAKDVFVLGGSDFHYQHEQIFYGWKPGAAHREPPDRKQTTLWPFDRPKRSEQHPTMKPVKLVAHALAMSSLRGELVADPFGGSGTTLIASEQLGRRCRTIELSPAYCDVIVQRWEQLTGRKAERHQR